MRRASIRTYRAVVGCAAAVFVAAALVLVGASNVDICAWGDEVAANENAAGQQGLATNSSASNSNSQSAASSDGTSNESAEDNGANSQAISLDPEENAIKENQKPDSSFIYDTAIDDLAKADSYYDQLTVQVVGEAVGDIIGDEFDGDYCWVVLWDDSSTVSVYMKKSDAETVDTLGSYSRKGTMLQVRGEFNLACEEHQGMSDIHAESVTVTNEGSTVSQSVSFYDFLPGILMVVAGLALVLLFFRMREKEL